MKNIEYYLLLIVFTIFIIMVGPALINDGMFVDGIMYATISKNLAFADYSSLFKLHYTICNDPVFYNQPPLTFWIQSVFFYLIGESIYVERLYSFLFFILNAFIIIKIWLLYKQKHELKLIFIPILFLLTFPVVIWSTKNNMIENTLSFFISLSVYFQLLFINTKQFKYILFAGIAICLGIFTKGLYALFPLSLLFFHWLIFKKISFSKTAFFISILFVSSILPIFILYFCNNEFNQYTTNYIDNQLIDSLTNNHNFDFRYFIIIRFLSEIIPAMCLTIIFIFYNMYKKYTKYVVSRDAFLFLLISLSGIIPVMISQKQNGYYIVPTYFLFAIFFGLINYNFFHNLFSNFKTKNIKILKLVSYLLIISSAFILFSLSNKPNRDATKISDIKLVNKLVSNNSIISITEELYYDWVLHAYFARNHNISLDKTLPLNGFYSRKSSVSGLFGKKKHIK